MMARDPDDRDLRFTERWRAFFETIDPAPSSTLLEDRTDTETGAEAAAVASGRGAHLSIAELFLRQEPEAWRDTDAFITLTATCAPKGGPPDTRAYFVGPDIIRRSSSVVPSGILGSDIRIDRLPWSSSGALTVAVALFRVQRNGKSGRVLDTLQDLGKGIDYDRDVEGSKAWADAMLDRVKILLHNNEAHPLLGAVHTLDPEAATMRATRHLLTESRPAARLSDLEKFVKSGRLFSGRAVDTASPYRLGEYLLLRSGAPPRRRGPTRSIQQLRRERALAGPPQPAEGDGDAETESLLAREARLRTLRRMANIYGGEAIRWRPLVTPIGIAVARNLVPSVEGGDGVLNPHFQDLVKYLRDGLQYDLGIVVPGINIRDDPLLGEGAYNVEINEIPIAAGYIPTDELLCSAAPAELAEIGITAREAEDPATRRAASYVSDEDAAKIRGGEIKINGREPTIWDSSGQIIRHMTTVLRRQAATFMSPSVAADLIRRANADAYHAIRDLPRGLPKFTEVLEALLDEGIPITAIEAIAERFLQLRQDDAPIYVIIDEMRILDAVAPTLRFQQDEVHVYELGGAFRNLIADGMVRSGDAALLAIEPEPTQSALSGIRSQIERLGPVDHSVYLLVEDHSLRRAVRKLVELEFSNLRVLARRDIANLRPDAVHTIATIELE